MIFGIVAREERAQPCVDDDEESDEEDRREENNEDQAEFVIAKPDKTLLIRNSIQIFVVFRQGSMFGRVCLKTSGHIILRDVLLIPLLFPGMTCFHMIAFQTQQDALPSHDTGDSKYGEENDHGFHGAIGGFRSSYARHDDE